MGISWPYGLGHYFFFCGFRLDPTSPPCTSICSSILAHSVPFVGNVLPSLHLSDEHLLRLQYTAQIFLSPGNLPWDPTLVQDSLLGIISTPCNVLSLSEQRRHQTAIVSSIRLGALQGKSQGRSNDLALAWPWQLLPGSKTRRLHMKDK